MDYLVTGVRPYTRVLATKSLGRNIPQLNPQASTLVFSVPFIWLVFTLSHVYLSDYYCGHPIVYTNKELISLEGKE
jgi:hypothetical protein